MDTASVLSELGLSEGEVKVYIALLKLGSVAVSDLKEETKLHRTTVYDFLEKLINKGLVSYVVKAGVNYYQATSPERLQDFLQEKQDKLKAVMPELKKLEEFHKEELKVEIFKGKEGFKTLFNQIINEGKDIYGLGFDESKYEQEMPIAVRQYFKKLKQKKIKEHIMLRQDTKYAYTKDEAPTTEYKMLPAEYTAPNPIMVFGDNVAIHNWNPLSVIMMKNKDLAASYKSYFDILWNNPVKIYRGKEGIINAFEEVVDASIKGGEYVAFGASTTSDYLIRYFDDFCRRQKKAGVISRIIFDEEAIAQMDMCLDYGWEVRTSPKRYKSPTEVNVAGNKTAIFVWAKEKEPLAMVIEDQTVADSFRSYFEFMWRQAPVYRRTR